MPLVSILLPSLRFEAVNAVINEFSRTNSSIDYEIVVVSPFDVTGDKVFHIREHERRGVIYAINEAFKHSSGRYIVAWSDDALPEYDCLKNMISFIETYEDPFVGSFRMRNAKGRELEQWMVYGKLYACWLCSSRNTLEQLGGGLFDPIYKNYWADPDLSLRVWTTGGAVKVCPNAWMKVLQADDKVKAENLRSSFEQDTASFFNIWHDKLGKNKKKVWNKINKSIPHSFTGRVRALLRSIPYSRDLKQYLSRLFSI